MAQTNGQASRWERTRGELERVAALLVSALACAFLTGAGALTALWISLPATDGAVGPSGLLALSPAVLVGWFLISGIAGLIGFVPCCLLLWSTDLSRSLRWVLLVTPVAQFVFTLWARGVWTVAAIPTMAVALSVMLVAHYRWPDAHYRWPKSDRVRAAR